MKAAILHQPGQLPVYEEVAAPIAGPDEVILTMKAASIKNLDRMRAKGTHYDSHKSFPAIVGVDGVGVLPDGTRVYAGSMKGMMSEKVAVAKSRLIPLPDEVDDVTAAALPNPAISAWATLAVKAKLKAGDSILVMGATGITGCLAVQLAKQMGAGRIVALGRNPEMLEKLLQLGADQVISLDQSAAAITTALQKAIAEKPFDIVVDYLWGQPAELVLQALTGNDLHADPHPTHYIQVGEMAGATIELKAATLRSSSITLSGVGGGSISHADLGKILKEVLPELFRAAAAGKLFIPIATVPLKDITHAWENEPKGKRTVVVL